jgi:hypothetical protein
MTHRVMRMAGGHGAEGSGPGPVEPTVHEGTPPPKIYNLHRLGRPKGDCVGEYGAENSPSAQTVL